LESTCRKVPLEEFELRPFSASSLRSLKFIITTTVSSAKLLLMATNTDAQKLSNSVDYDLGKKGVGVHVDTLEDGVLDTHENLEPIAIVGFAFEFAHGAISPDDFWAMLVEGRSAMTGWPEDRLNFSSFYHTDGSRKENVSNKYICTMESLC
jgi:hypothetical protein